MKNTFVSSQSYVHPKDPADRTFRMDRIFMIYLGLMSASTLFAGKWEYSINGALKTQTGNTDVSSFSVALSSQHEGDFTIGSWTLKDAEIKFSIGHSRGKLKDVLYENDGNASFLLNYHANQKFSPFFHFYFEFDSTASLENRTQMGFGAKYRITKPISISILGLWEMEDYVGEDQASQLRWSIRTKYKKSFNSGVSVSYVAFYKPLQRDFNNYLLEHYATVTLATKISWLSVNVTLEDKFNSRPPTDTKKKDVDVTVGITLTF